jgi:predicted nucleic acid-binding protein
MGALTLDGLPADALLLVDTAPIIYIFEGRNEFAERFRPVFDAQRAGAVRLAVTTVTLAEVMTGPLRVGDEGLAKRYRSVLETWQVVPLDSNIAESAARLRAAYRLKLPDAVQAASAIAINANALVTHDRDFSRLMSLHVIA